MDPEANKLVPLIKQDDDEMADVVARFTDMGSRFSKKYRENVLTDDGRPVPRDWAVFNVGDERDIDGHRFRVAHIGEKHLLLEPVGPVVVKKKIINKKPNARKRQRKRRK